MAYPHKFLAENYLMVDENDTARFKLLDRIPVIYKEMTCHVYLYMTSSSMTVECPWPVANAVKRFFKLKYHKSDKFDKVDFAYTHKDSHNYDRYQVVEWRNWPRRLKKYIGALGQIERVMKLKFYNPNDGPGPWRTYEFHVKLVNETTNI